MQTATLPPAKELSWLPGLIPLIDKLGNNASDIKLLTFTTSEDPDAEDFEVRMEEQAVWSVKGSVLLTSGKSDINSRNNIASLNAYLAKHGLDIEIGVVRGKLLLLVAPDTELNNLANFH